MNRAVVEILRFGRFMISGVVSLEGRWTLNHQGFLRSPAFEVLDVRRIINRTTSLPIKVVLGVMLGLTTLAVCAEGEEQIKEGIFSAKIKGANNHYPFSFVLPAARPGESVRARIRVDNFSNADFEILDARGSCKCITVKIPKTKVEVGTSCMFELVFKVPERPTNLTERYQVTVDLRGTQNSITLNFECKLTEAVCFITAESIWHYSLRSGPQKVRIPILCSDKSLLKDVIPIANAAFGFSNPRIVNEGDRTYAEFTLESSKREHGTTIEEIRLERNGTVVSQQLLTLKYNSIVRILPDKVVFTLGKSADVSREATVILKVEPDGDDSDDVSVESVSCHVENGKTLRTSVTSVSSGLYRIRITASESDDLAQNSILNWKIVKTNQKRFEVRTESFLSN